MNEYTPSEMMIVTAARALAGVRTVLVGVGQPNIACNLARRIVEPNLELIYESGVFGARPARLPLSIGDPTLVSGAQMVCSMADLFLLYLQGGRVDVALLGTAQIDRFGNLNTTVIGDYAQPKVRLPGSGGACEIAIHARKVFIITPLSRRTFVEKLDFVTSPGHLDGQPGARRKSGMPGNGPQLVITNKAIFDFGGEAPEMRLISVHPGVTVEDVQAEVSWPLKVAPHIVETGAPSPEELHIIRQQLDPDGIYRS
ncbi:MAG: CoA-transferase subunit beta [Chloroflexi bacterium]|nr:CoA-transferase subunit beta [Chloroflexota bacterium]MBU1660698.1 CoA-transferase subunit beta [Chloroflexota bacterium]